MEINNHEKGPIRSFRDLDVYQTSYQAMLAVHKEILPQLSGSEKYDLRDQLSRSSKAVPRLIAEGHSKRHQHAGFQKYIDDAHAEANETIVSLEQCRDLYKINAELCIKLVDTYDKIARQLFNLAAAWDQFKSRRRQTQPLDDTRGAAVQHKTHPGFTLIELLVVAGMTVILATVVTLSFQGLRSSQEINAARADFISKLRGIQGNILGGKIVAGITQAADAYVITLNTGSDNYQIDYEVNCEVACVSTLLETVRYSQFGSGVTLDSMTVNGSPDASVVIRISAPYGAIFVDAAANRVVVARLLHASGQTKDVLIDGISGRVAPQ